MSEVTLVQNSLLELWEWAALLQMKGLLFRCRVAMLQMKGLLFGCGVAM